MQYAAVVPVILAMLLGFPCSLPAEDGQVAPSEQEVSRLLDQKAYDQAEAMCRQLLANDHTDKIAAYNLACALARQGKTDDAISALGRAAELGFDDADHARVDDDLVSLHDQPRFKVVITAMQDHQNAEHRKAMQGIAYEPGVPMAGITTVEGDPATGLRWRLHLGKDATAAKPERLIVWLHPAGASDNAQVEPLATDLTHHGFAFAVFTQKQFKCWTPEEMDKIWVSTQDMGHQPGVDARRPVLMGFNAGDKVGFDAGGRAALLCWSSHPELWSALLLDAAYPFTITGNQASVIPLTPAMLAAKIPILALVGGNDHGVQLWNIVAPIWIQHGQAVDLRVVPGRDQELLFSGDEWKATLEFLDELKAAGPAKNAARTDGGHDDSQLP